MGQSARNFVRLVFLEPWLGGADYLREVPWIYANPIRVSETSAEAAAP